MKKLSTSDVIAHLENGAILTKNYGVYSHWDLKLIDGSFIYDDDIMVPVVRDGVKGFGPRIQYEQMIGLGLIWKFL